MNEKKNEWKVMAKDGRGVRKFLWDLYKDMWEFIKRGGGQGFTYVVYVADVDKENKIVYINDDLTTPNTIYKWTRDYNSPDIIIARYDPYRVWDLDGVEWDEEKQMYNDNGEYVSEEELLEGYTEWFVEEDEGGIIEEAIRVAKKIIEYEYGEE